MSKVTVDIEPKTSRMTVPKSLAPVADNLTALRFSRTPSQGHRKTTAKRFWAIIFSPNKIFQNATKTCHRAATKSLGAKFKYSRLNDL